MEPKQPNIVLVAYVYVSCCKTVKQAAFVKAPWTWQCHYASVKCRLYPRRSKVGIDWLVSWLEEGYSTAVMMIFKSFIKQNDSDFSFVMICIIANWISLCFVLLLKQNKPFKGVTFKCVGNCDRHFSRPTSIL